MLLLNNDDEVEGREGTRKHVDDTSCYNVNLKYTLISVIKHVADLPSPIHRIIYYIDDLTFQGTPDYEYIGVALKRAAALKDADLNEPFDWKKPKEVDVSFIVEVILYFYQMIAIHSFSKFPSSNFLLNDILRN